METFDWTKFDQKIAVKDSIQNIYNAWAIPNEIEKWFLKSADYTNGNGEKVSKEAAVNIGDTYAWTWYLHDGTGTGEITAANGVNHFQFTFANSVVDINLSEKDDHVLVSLTQNNIPTDSESKRGIRLGCHTGWSFFIVGLKAYYENGIDLRNKDERFKGSVN